MYLIDKLTIIVLGVFAYSISLLIPSDLINYGSLLSNSITFLSISVGFYGASLSIIFTSDFINNTYSKIPDGKFKGKVTLLDTLIAYFRTILYLALFSVAILVLHSSIKYPDIIFKFIDIKYINNIVYSILVVNIYTIKIIFKLITTCIKFQKK